MKDGIMDEMQMKDEIIDEMQTNARENGYIALEDAIRQLLAAGVSESAITLSTRVIYHDIVDDLNNEEGN